MTDGQVHRHRGLYWSAVLLALAALVGGSAFAYRAYEQTSGPDGAVKGYFAALSRSDAAAALAFGDLPAGPHALLTASVLREQQRIAPIRDVHVVDVDQDRSLAHVTVAYTLGFQARPQQVSDVVPVRRSGRSWKLAQTAIPATISITQAIQRATILGAAVPEGRTLLFPGAVPISFDTPYLQVSAGSGYVGFGSGKSAKVAVDVSAAGRKAVASALTANLTKCLTAAAHAAASCPLPSDRVVPGSLRGHLIGSVADRMSVDVDTTGAGVIDVTGSVPFEGSYRKLDYDNVASVKHGTVQLPLDSITYAVAPLALRWTGPT